MYSLTSWPMMKSMPGPTTLLPINVLQRAAPRYPGKAAALERDSLIQEP